MVNPTELQAKLELLCDAYAAQLPEKIKQVEQVWERLPQNSWDEEGFQTLHRMVHSLTGSGMTFGFSLLSDAARDLEEHLKRIAQAKTALNERQRRQILELMGDLHQAILHRDVRAVDKAGLIEIAAINRNSVRSKHVFVVDDDLEQAVELQVQLSYFGYEVNIFSNLADFRLAMQPNPDVVVVMDMSFPKDNQGGVHAIKEIQQERKVPLPVVFLTAHNDYDARLEAVRAGSIAYLIKPININSLIDKLDCLASTLPTAPYRVLIVDDSELFTSYYAAVLEQAGMVVKAINNPVDVISQLLEFTPDLILLDLYMPKCSGLELAKVIRQLDEFVSIPIVFLSAEKDLDKKLFAIGLGADDFLTKPILPQHLISSISSRIQRSHVLRSFMVRDSLTGLLNHSAIQNQLDYEVARAKRQRTPLAFAMIDIDHFKQVNDTYGHPVGDRVIKSLSRLLKQRLRRTDIVGRYGGEEFAIILSNADGMAAKEILDAIRVDFSLVHHQADGNEFIITFSCGIADMSDYYNVAKLAEAADKALYKAKHSGRNQVVVADTSMASIVTSK